MFVCLFSGCGLVHSSLLAQNARMYGKRRKLWEYGYTNFLSNKTKRGMGKGTAIHNNCNRVEEG